MHESANRDGGFGQLGGDPPAGSNETRTGGGYNGSGIGGASGSGGGIGASVNMSLKKRRKKKLKMIFLHWLARASLQKSQIYCVSGLKATI